jgi:ATP-binding cassette, subfamily F, member 3
MHIIQLDRVAANHAGRVIFQDLSWSIGDKEHIGLIGPNGAGKSTLLKLIMGEVSLNGGTLTRMRGVTVGYLPQEVTLPPGQTLLQAAMILPPELSRVEADLQRIEEQIGNEDVYSDPDALARALTRQEKALAEWDRLGGAQHANRIRGMLTGLGFTGDDLNLPTETLSGGQKKLVAFVRLATEQPDVLLLDEPDNHLDLEAKQALEGFIRDYRGTVITVSHDRYLLDGIASTIIELEDGRLNVYKGNYTAYVNEKELRRLRQQQMYIAQQKEINRIEAAIARFEHWASIVIDERHIKQARSRRKMLDRMEANGEIIEKVTERRQMAVQFEGWRGSTKVIEARNLAMAFGDDLLFSNVDILIQHGERVGLCGDNGVGKSVLFKLIMGEYAPFDGLIKIGPSVKIGYYSQEHQTLRDWLHRTPVERIRDLAPIPEGDAVSFLGKFLFNYQQTRQPIGTLSGGERSRLQLACLMLQKPNLLLLDEPTNNLDIPSCEALEAALDDFEGTVFTISHDRYYLDKVVDRVIGLEQGGVRCYEGGYTDYVNARG